MDRLPFETVDRFLVERHGIAHERRIEIRKKNGAVEVRYEPSRDGDSDRFTATVVGIMLRPVRPVCRSTIAAWRANGLTLDQADRVADMLGYYPGNIWPEWSSLLDCDEQLELALTA